MKKLMYVLIGVIVVATVANLFIPSVNSLSDLKHVNYSETFDQKEDDYLVYFYMESCGLCQQFSPELIDAYTNEKLNVYVVDMENDSNIPAWYDWEAHQEKYDKVIGKVENGVEVFNEGESRDKYPAFDGWVVSVDGTDIITEKRTAVNNKKPANASELQVSGTPAMLRVKDGEFFAYGEGIDVVRSILEEAKK
ncbi:MAG: thioredoxin domain-containing protein [Turicibacter sp.]